MLAVLHKGDHAVSKYLCINYCQREASPERVVLAQEKKIDDVYLCVCVCVCADRASKRTISCGSCGGWAPRVYFLAGASYSSIAETTHSNSTSASPPIMCTIMCNSFLHLISSHVKLVVPDLRAAGNTRASAINARFLRALQRSAGGASGSAVA